MIGYDSKKWLDFRQKAVLFLVLKELEYRLYNNKPALWRCIVYHICLR